MIKDKKTLLITGSSGYVASYLIPKIPKSFRIYGIDAMPGKYTDFVCNINEIYRYINSIEGRSLIIINLAAIRFDFGSDSKNYYDKNVEEHKLFLSHLNAKRIKKFIHVSSVASIDGRKIPFSRNLNCDDAYRSSKHLQEILIQNWCCKNQIKLITIFPSAIFSDNPRGDTNIGKLQSIAKFIPFIPKIDIVKSLTYLPNLSNFINESLSNKIAPGKYLTIEKPSLNVSKIIQIVSGRSIKLIYIPFLRSILMMIAHFLYILGLYGRIDLKLTPNRVIKLFTDTSYDLIDDFEIDTQKYSSMNYESLSNILNKISSK